MNKRAYKFEIRSTKSETSTKVQNPNDQNKNFKLVILSPSPVILSKAKDLVLWLRVNSAKDLGLWLRGNSMT